MKNEVDYSFLALEYANDIVENYFQTEKHNLSKINTKQTIIRSHIVEVLQSFSLLYEMNEETLFLAVNILDCYMNEYVISEKKDHQAFLAYVILLLAGKCIDLDSVIPNYRNVLHYIDFTSELGGVDVQAETNIDVLKAAYATFSKTYLALEFSVFASIKFNMNQVTAITFVNIFKSFIATEEDLLYFNVLNTDLNLCMLEEQASKILKEYLDVILFNIEFNLFLPSKVAAATIGCVRLSLGIDTFWNENLASITRATVSEISPIMQLINANRMDTEADSSTELIDSGFSEDTSTPVQISKKPKID